VRGAGFQVEARNVRDDSLTAVRRASGVPDVLESCHTAQVAGYVIEGHVPAEAIRRLLRERPADVAGLAVPGMPAGSPGMGTSGQGDGHYDVLAFGRDGRTRVYERH
jgi:hypothetical protein